MSSEDLKFVETDALVTELQARFDGLVIIGCKNITSSNYQVFGPSIGGGPHLALGLLQHAEMVVCRDIGALEDEQEPGNEDDGTTPDLGSSEPNP